MNKITVTVDARYLVHGIIPLAHQHIVTNAQDESLEWREGDAVVAPQFAVQAIGRWWQKMGSKRYPHASC